MSRRKQRFNYKQYWNDNISYMMSDEWKKSKTVAIINQVYYTIRMFCRWNFNGKKWKPLINEGMPAWIK